MIERIQTASLRSEVITEDVFVELPTTFMVIPTVWFATNGEIMDYVNAYRRLEYAADGQLIRNPSALDVTIRTQTDFVTLPAGKVTRI